MAEKTLAEEIITIIEAHSNDNPAPTQATIIRTYEDGNYADVETTDGTHRYIPVIGDNTLYNAGVIVYLDGDLNTPLMITSGDGGGSEVDIVTEWETTLSDEKVPSEKLVKTDLDKKIAKSDTVGLVKNDGTIDTTQYSTFSGDYDDLTDKPELFTKKQLLTLLAHEDLIVEDNGDNTTQWWNYNNIITVTTDTNGKTLTGGSGTGYYILNPHEDTSTTSSDYNLYDKWTIEFDIVSITFNSRHIQLNIRDSTSTNHSINLDGLTGMSDSFTGHVRFRYDGNKFYYKLGDNEEQSTTLTLGTVRLGFVLPNTNTVNLTYTNLITYPIGD